MSGMHSVLGTDKMDTLKAAMDRCGEDEALMWE